MQRSVYTYPQAALGLQLGHVSSSQPHGQKPGFNSHFLHVPMCPARRTTRMELLGLAQQGCRCCGQVRGDSGEEASLVLTVQEVHKRRAGRSVASGGHGPDSSHQPRDTASWGQECSVAQIRRKLRMATSPFCTMS